MQLLNVKCQQADNKESIAIFSIPLLIQKDKYGYKLQYAPIKIRTTFCKNFLTWKNYACNLFLYIVTVKKVDCYWFERAKC